MPAGPAPRFRGPHGIAAIGQALYVADGPSKVVRKVDLPEGTMSVFAGAPDNAGSADGPAASARFGSVSSVATDGADLYVLDSGNSTIRALVKLPALSSLWNRGVTRSS